MACCGKGKRKPAKPNGKTCPRCGWIMNRVHKYDTNERRVVRYFLCSNKYRKPGARGGVCAYREPIE